MKLFNRDEYQNSLNESLEDLSKKPESGIHLLSSDKKFSGKTSKILFGKKDVKDCSIMGCYKPIRKSGQLYVFFSSNGEQPDLFTQFTYVKEYDTLVVKFEDKTFTNNEISSLYLGDFYPDEESLKNLAEAIKGNPEFLEKTDSLVRTAVKNGFRG